MTQPSHPQPLAEAVHGTLDQRIQQVEARLIARELHLQQGWQSLARRAHRATEPRRMVWPLLGGVLALWAAGWALRRLGGKRSNVHAQRAVGYSSAESPLRSPLPWLRGAAIAWPLLPAHWRARVHPGTASLFMAVGLPLAELLFKRRP